MGCLLKFIQYLLLVFRRDEPGERHLIHLFNVVVLVRLLLGSRKSLAFQGGPFLSVENEQVRDALNLVHLENHAAGEERLQCLDESILKTAFQSGASGHEEASFLDKDNRKNEKCVTHLSPLHKRGCFFGGSQNKHKKSRDTRKHLGSG